MMALPIKKHAALSTAGFIAGIGALAWIQPATTGGSLVVMSTGFILFNSFGLMLGRSKAKQPTPTQSPKGMALDAVNAMLGRNEAKEAPAVHSRRRKPLVTASAISTASYVEGAPHDQRPKRKPRTQPTAPVSQFVLAALLPCLGLFACANPAPNDSQTSTPPKAGAATAPALAPAPSAAAATESSGSASNPAGHEDRTADRMVASLRPTGTGGSTRGILSPFASTSSPSLDAVRIFARSDYIPTVAAAYGAYGVVAFRSKPTPASQARLQRVCTSFLSALPPRDEGAVATKPDRDLMATIWPVDDPTVAHPSDCEYLIAHYDLYAGQTAIRDAERQGRELDGRGPFLIGWAPSNARGEPGAVVLVIDLSPFDRQESFDEMFQFWQSKIVEDPALWKNGFSVERVRLVTREFVDQYGDNIMKAISAWAR
jgi:hypothetical protein